jgi:hypothetical protein
MISRRIRRLRPQLVGQPANLGGRVAAVATKGSQENGSLPSLNQRDTVLGQSSVPWVTAKLTAKLDDTKGPQGIAMDVYIRPELRRRDRR